MFVAYERGVDSLPFGRAARAEEQVDVSQVAELERIELVVLDYAQVGDITS